MTSEEFVEAVRQHVQHSAAEETLENLRAPPGRSVAKDVRARSVWYNGLDPEAAAHVGRIVESAAHAAVFGLFAILDGVRTIDDAGGEFELTYVGEKRLVLNDPAAIGLHELLNATEQVP